MLSTTAEASEFRKKFHGYYHENIAKDLAEFEEQRAPKLFVYNIWIAMAVITVIVGICVLIYCANIFPSEVFWGKSEHQDGLWSRIAYVFGAIFCGFFYLANRVKKGFEKKIKTKIIQSFLLFFGDFRWSMNERISEREINSSELLTGNPLYRSIKSDDYFEGTFNGTKIVISEVKVYRKREVYFDGIFIKLGMNKKSSAHTIIVGDSKINSLIYRKEKVTLEDPEFESIFDVYSDNQVEARYILTTAFMERLKNLKDIYNATTIKASIKDDSILIALPCKKDMFSLGNLRKPVTDSGQIQTLFEEFLAVLSTVEVLNLNSKTGL